MEEQGLGPETVQPDGLDSVNPPFALSDVDEADSASSVIEPPPPPAPAVEEDTPVPPDAEEPPEERQPLVVGTRRRAPAPVAYTPEPSAGGSGCADLITAIFLLMTIGVCAFTSLLIIYPRSPLNPFPAPTFEAVMVLCSPIPTDTPTNTSTPLPATQTPTPTATLTPAATFTPTWTPSPTFTPVGRGLPTATSSPT